MTGIGVISHTTDEALDLHETLSGERTWQFGWDCGCGAHHSLISRWSPTLWDQCPVSGIWYRLEEHDATT